MIELGLGEENVPLMAFFLHVVLLLFARVLLLPFEANLLFALFGS